MSSPHYTYETRGECATFRGPGLSPFAPAVKADRDDAVSLCLMLERAYTAGKRDKAAEMRHVFETP
jgi:hypothetical protein